MSRANAALILGMSEGKIYNIESGVTQKRIIFCQNVQKQLTERRSPGEGEKRCDCCGKIRKVEEFPVRNGKPKRHCDLCGRGWIDGEQVSFKTFDALPTVRSAGAIMGAYKQTKDYPYLLHLAMRRNSIPTMQIAKKLGVSYNKCKVITSKMGVADPKTKICGSGSDHPRWKGGKIQTSIIDDWIWNQEVKQYRRAKKLTCWSQHIEAQRWEWNHKYHNSSPEFKIKRRLRKAIRQAINQQSVQKKTQLALGCDIKFLRAYLETRFEEGMTWDNYGSGWHIDHVKPLASFDLSKKSEQLKANHYTNLQPLWASDNLLKGDKYYKQPTLLKCI